VERGNHGPQATASVKLKARVGHSSSSHCQQAFNIAVGSVQELLDEVDVEHLRYLVQLRLYSNCLFAILFGRAHMFR